MLLPAHQTRAQARSRTSARQRPWPPRQTLRLPPPPPQRLLSSAEWVVSQVTGPTREAPPSGRPHRRPPLPIPLPPQAHWTAPGQKREARQPLSRAPRPAPPPRVPRQATAPPAQRARPADPSRAPPRPPWTPSSQWCQSRRRCRRRRQRTLHPPTAVRGALHGGTPRQSAPRSPPQSPPPRRPPPPRRSGSSRPPRRQPQQRRLPPRPRPPRTSCVATGRLGPLRPRHCPKASQKAGGAAGRRRQPQLRHRPSETRPRRCCRRSCWSIRQPRLTPGAALQSSPQCMS